MSQVHATVVFFLCVKIIKKRLHDISTNTDLRQGDNLPFKLSNTLEAYRIKDGDKLNNTVISTDSFVFQRNLVLEVLVSKKSSLRNFLHE